MKTIRPEIFVSATSADLKTCRSFIKEAILSLGCIPVEQDNFPPEASSVREMLRKRIGDCDAVLHVAGKVYGAEPTERDPSHPRRSYTQMEYDIARQLSKPIYVFICGDGFPYDDFEPEDEEKCELQRRHRARLQSGDHIYTPVETRDELRNRVYQLQANVEKLHEELKRSHLWLKRGLAAGLVIAILLALSALFSSDIRDLFRNEQERAIAALEARGIALDVDGLGRTLTAASVEDLTLFLQAGVSKQLLNRAFAENAASFFESSRDAPQAIEWFRAALDHGLDPNLPATYDYYGKESILAAAMRASNTGAVLALLDAGASPHPYQNLWLTDASLPRFLFPYHYVLKNDQLSREEKARIAKAFTEAGALIMPLKADPQKIRYDHRESIEDVFGNAETVFGFNVPETPSACHGRSPTPICREASARTGRDWCKIMQELPVRVLWNPENNDFRLSGFDLQYLLNVIDGRGYILVTDTFRSRNGGYGLLEISADLTQWNLYKYMWPEAGMGHCKARSNGYVPDDCWRRWSMTYSPGDSVVRVSDYYDYQALFNCAKDRPDKFN